MIWLPVAAGAYDTIWFGGDDGHGVGFEGGLWDWDTIVTDPLQGWTANDPTANPAVYFGRVTADDFIAHGDPCVPLTTGGILWCGIHEDEADLRGFVAGIGYQNDMCQWARSPVVTLDPQATELTIAFLYFNDTEEGFDFTHVALRCLADGGAFLDELALESMTGIIGAPDALASYTRPVATAALPAGTAAVQVEVRMEADGGWSDEDGYYDSACGPFGLDDAALTTGASIFAWDFDEGAQGWTFDKCPGAGNFMGVLAEAVWGPWLDEVGLSGCPHSGNAWDFVDEEHSPFYPPGITGQTLQTAISGPIARGAYSPAVWDTAVVESCVYLNSGVMFRPGYMIYPVTSEAWPTPHWSERRGQTVWFYGAGPQCGCRVDNLSRMADDPLPAEWDSLKFVLEVYTWADLDSRGAPLLDNVRIGLVPGAGSGVEEDPWPAVSVSAVITGVAPNPAHGGTTVHLDLPPGWTGSATIHDLAGRRIRTLAERLQGHGRGQLAWDGRDAAGQPVPTGAYWVRLAQANGSEACRRVVVVE